MLTDAQKDAVHKICQAAWDSCKPDVDLAAFTASQCVLESSYLSRAPNFNCFGIKADGHGSGTQYVLTHEFLNGQWQEMSLAFETYPSLAACFADHARLIRQGVYLPAWQQYRVDHNIDNYIRGVSAHYATDPRYSDQMIAETHSLTIQIVLQPIASGAIK